MRWPPPRTLVGKGVRYLVLALPADAVLAVADAVKDTGAVVLNAGAPDDRLRGADCRANVFHVLPSRAMLTDALAQYLTVMRWRKLFLIVGPTEADKAYADAVRNSARKFALKITAEKPWTFGPLAKARGDTPTRAEAMVFTRGLDYDMADRRRRGGRLGRLRLLSHGRSAARRRNAGADADHLVAGAGDLGRRAGAEPLPAARRPG